MEDGTKPFPEKQNRVLEKNGMNTETMDDVNR